MLALAHHDAVVSFRRMDDTTTPEIAERVLMGRVVRRLRMALGLTHAQAAARLDVAPQTWQRYEAGDRQFTVDLIERICGALELTPEDLAHERTKVLANPSAPNRPSPKALVDGRRTHLEIPVWGRVRAGPTGPQVYDGTEPESVIDASSLFGSGTGAMRLAGESMTPWGEPGELVIFDRNRYPKRGHGCIVETKAGEYYVKLYERSDGSTLFVKELYPEERTITFRLDALKGVYAVRLRGD